MVFSPSGNDSFCQHLLAAVKVLAEELGGDSACEGFIALLFQLLVKISDDGVGLGFRDAQNLHQVVDSKKLGDSFHIDSPFLPFHRVGSFVLRHELPHFWDKLVAGAPPGCTVNHGGALDVRSLGDVSICQAVCCAKGE